MKKIAHVILFGVVACGLTLSSAVAQTKKAQSNDAAQSKVSKADAEDLVVKRNPGATVLNSTEVTVNGHKVWSVSVATTGGNVARKVYVDEETGKLSY